MAIVSVFRGDRGDMAIVSVFGIEIYRGPMRDFPVGLSWFAAEKMGALFDARTPLHPRARQELLMRAYRRHMKEIIARGGPP